MFGQLTPITRNIIILNVAVFAFSYLFPLLNVILPAYYPFSPNFKSWQIVTHMFMHGGLVHILFNMLTLASFGPVLEQYLKEKRYLILYFASGLGAFILFNLWNFYEVQTIVSSLRSVGVDPSEIYAQSAIGYQGPNTNPGTTPESRELAQQLYNALRIPMVGASGAIFGVVAAFSTLFPDAKLMFMFIPFPIKAKYLFPIIVIVSVYLGFSGSMSGIAHFAHVGGAIVGFILAKIWNKNKFRIQ